MIIASIIKFVLVHVQEYTYIFVNLSTRKINLLSRIHTAFLKLLDTKQNKYVQYQHKLDTEHLNNDVNSDSIDLKKNYLQIK